MTSNKEGFEGRRGAARLAPMAGSQDFAVDPRNADLRIYVNGELVPRDQAKVSVFDAGFVLGDGVWEGLRLHKRALLFLEAHLDRIYAGAAAIQLLGNLVADELQVPRASPGKARRPVVEE